MGVVGISAELTPGKASLATRPSFQSGADRRSWSGAGSRSRLQSSLQTRQSQRTHALPSRPDKDAGGPLTLERPAIITPDKDKQKQTTKQRPPQYRVMLHNDSFNKREYVVQVLLKVVDGYTLADAVNVMNKAHVDGLACVITCAQEDAEVYCEGLRGNGLISSVEPDS